jgi:hypothetical protein
LSKTRDVVIVYISIQTMKRTSPESERPQGPPLKVPKRTAPTPVIRAQYGFRTGPASPIRSRLSTVEKLFAAVKAQKLIYNYSSITKDQIRLLRVVCGETQDDISVSIETVSFEDLGNLYEYEALSYHWGSGEAEYPVYIRDAKPLGSVKKFDEAVLLAMKSKRIFVRPNLYKALQNLRQNDRDILLWVDAVCINQENREEKKIQVSKMAQIYHMAERVCIWLGAGNERSDKAMKFISKIVDLRELEDITKEERYTAQWNDLADLMTSSWFSRRWVIQELALAKDATVHCGKAEVHWNDFRDAISLFVQHFDTIRKLFKDSKQFGHNYYAIGELDPLGAKVLVDVASNIFRKNANGDIFEPILSLETLVSTLSTFEASDPRDTIHALRNISREIHWDSSPEEAQALRNAPPKPDYSKDLLEVYTDFVRWVIETTGSLDIICRHWALPEKETKEPYRYPELVKLPSWVQEISESPYGRQQEGYKRRKNGDSFVGTPDRRCYNASHGKSAEAWFGVDLQQSTTSTTSEQAQSNGASNGVGSPRAKKPRDPSLYVKGLLIDTITWVSGAIADGVIPKKCLEKGDWSGTRENEATQVPDKLWRTLVADRGADGRNPPSLYHRACLHCLVNDTPNGHINTRELLDENRGNIARDYLKRVQAVTWNRVFLEADSQKEGVETLFGVGPPETGLKDVICILFGCSVPCILREHPHPEGGTYFELIGEAYIYGKMDGEAVTALSEEDLRDKIKVFRLM